MNTHMDFKLKKMLLLSAKIALGSSCAIYVAQLLELQNAMSAGIITLLTLVTTKWETFRLSGLRVFTYAVTIAICYLVFATIPSKWIEFGVFLFILVFIGEKMGWRSTLSVNAVIGTHFLSSQDFSIDFIINELLLVLIGILIAIVLNLIHINDLHERRIVKAMRQVEKQMQEILIELAGYLVRKSSGDSVWDDIKKLESDLEEYIELAFEYQNNTFDSHQSYYIDYFEMRLQQCGALDNLHSEMKRMRDMPRQAHIVTDFILKIAIHVAEVDNPKELMDELQRLVDEIHDDELPKTKEEFMNQAELYHTLMDLEELLMYKHRFNEAMDSVQFRIYWEKAHEQK